MTPAISVVIPHYDDPDGLARALASLDAQAGAPPFEIVVVDNASPVPPDAVCAGRPATRLLSEPDRGPGPARTTGARAARAPLIAFLDSDCVADPDWLARIAARFEAEPDTDVIGGAVRILPRDPARRNALECYEEVYSYRQRLFVERDGYAATCNMAVRAAAFAEVGGFGGIEIAEDWEWGQRAGAAGKRIVFAPEVRIATPARETFAELARKWDRQIGHGFAELRGRPARLALWTIKALVMPVSSLAEIPTLMRTERLSGVSERLRAFLCLTRTRLWRARRMLQLLFGLEAGALAAGWRRGRSAGDRPAP